MLVPPGPVRWIKAERNVGTSTALYRKVRKEPFLIGIEVELFGNLPCVNPNKHPKPPVHHYGLLNSIGTGCGLFKEDSTSLLAN